MKTCPTCKVPLERQSYEGFPVDRCPSCTGCLVRKSGVEGIKRKREADSAQLVAEAQAFEASSGRDLNCPACFRPMSKRNTVGFPKVEYDECKGCGAIWFDPGELAMLQLTYEASDKARFNEEMQERVEALESDPARKRRFEENLAQCPDGNYSLGEAVSQGIIEGIVSGVLRSHYRGRL